METLNRDIHGKEGRLLPRRSVWLWLLVVTLGTAVFFLPGCGSDSKPGGALSAKKEKAATGAKTGKLQGTMPLMMEGTVPGDPRKMGQAPKAPNSQRIEVLDGMTLEELEARAVESQAQLEKARESHDVILDGMTQEQLEAKAAESQKRLESEGGGEIFPGITQQELEMRARQGQRHDPRPIQKVFPGITQEQMDASAKTPTPDHREMFPPSGEK